MIIHKRKLYIVNNLVEFSPRARPDIQMFIYIIQLCRLEQRYKIRFIVWEFIKHLWVFEVRRTNSKILVIRTIYAVDLILCGGYNVEPYRHMLPHHNGDFSNRGARTCFYCRRTTVTHVVITLCRWIEVFGD